MNYSLVNELSGLFSWYNILLLLQGLGRTLALSAFGCLVGFLLGFVLAIFGNTSSKVLKPLRGLIRIYCFMFRRIPFLVTLMLIFLSASIPV